MTGRGARHQGSSVYMRNVYTRGCGVLVQQPGSRHASLVAPGTAAAGTWSHVHELARGVDCPASMADQGKVTQHTIVFASSCTPSLSVSHMVDVYDRMHCDPCR